MPKNQVTRLCDGTGDIIAPNDKALRRVRVSFRHGNETHAENIRNDEHYAGLTFKNADAMHKWLKERADD
jgi:hypothetical protein